MALMWGAALGLGFLFFKQGDLTFILRHFTKYQCEHFTLPVLAYDYNALEPYIDELTMKIHHTKHHQKYVTMLNEAVDEYPALSSKPLKEWLGNINSLPLAVRNKVRNHGGGHFNHSFFWECMTPALTHGEPHGDLKSALEKSFESVDSFKEKFETAARNLFGSGWVWLCLNKSENVVIVTTQNQDTPLAQELEPLLALDVWEHAYYLKYQANRADYIKAWWHVVNWEQVEKNFHEAHTTVFEKP